MVDYENKLYSLKEMVEEYLHTNSKKVTNDFIDFLLRSHILKRTTFRYCNNTVIKNVYSVDDWFSIKAEGHYCTEVKRYKGVELNGTLYFDEFLAKVLTRLYRLKEHHNDYNVAIKYLDSVMLNTAMDYLPKIKTI